MGRVCLPVEQLWMKETYSCNKSVSTNTLSLMRSFFFLKFFHTDESSELSNNLPFVLVWASLVIRFDSCHVNDCPENQLQKIHFTALGQLLRKMLKLPVKVVHFKQTRTHASSATICPVQVPINGAHSRKSLFFRVVALTRLCSSGFIYFLASHKLMASSLQRNYVLKNITFRVTSSFWVIYGPHILQLSAGWIRKSRAGFDRL